MTVVVSLYDRGRWSPPFWRGGLRESLKDAAVITHAYDGYCINDEAGDGRSPVEITHEVGAGPRGREAAPSLSRCATTKAGRD